MVGEYFTSGLEAPEAPRLSFFRGLFGGPGASTLDREELFGPEPTSTNAANSRAAAAAATTGKSAADLKVKVRKIIRIMELI